MALNLGAILTAMVTPFNSSGEVDKAAATALLQHLFGHGCDGVVVCGTTGEATTLDDDEHIGFIELVVSEVHDQLPGKTIIADVGSGDTGTAQCVHGGRHGSPPGRVAGCQSVLQPPEQARHHRALRRGGSRNRPPDHPLQHPQAHRRRHAQRPDRGAGPASSTWLPFPSRPTRTTSPRSTASSCMRATTTCLRRCSIWASPAGSRLGATCSAMRCGGWCDEPSNRHQIDADLQDVLPRHGAYQLPGGMQPRRAGLNMIGVEVGGPRLPVRGARRS